MTAAPPPRRGAAWAGGDEGWGGRGLTSATASLCQSLKQVQWGHHATCSAGTRDVVFPDASAGRDKVI